VHPVQVLVTIVFAVALISAFVALWQFSKYLQLWKRARLSAVHVSLFDLIGMTLRKVEPSRVIDNLIRASQGGVTLRVRDLESAYLQGVDIDKLTTAALVAKNRGMKLSFKELVATELEGQLAEQLGLSPTSPSDP